MFMHKFEDTFKANQYVARKNDQMAISEVGFTRSDGSESTNQVVCLSLELFNKLVENSTIDIEVVG
jgi:hypothetical protein